MIEKIILQIIIIMYLTIKIVLFQFEINLNRKPFRKRVHSITILAVFSSVILLSIPFFVIFIKNGILASLFLIVLIDIILFVDLLYCRYYYVLISMDIIINQLKLVSKITDSIFALIKIKDLKYLLDIPVLFLVLVFYKPIIVTEYISFFLIQLILGICGIAFYFYIKRKIDVKKHICSVLRRARDLGILYYHWIDIYYYIKKYCKRKKKEDIKLLKENLEQIPINNNLNQYSGLGKGKHLLVVQMESFQSFLIDRKINGEEITPNINMLLKKSIYCSNFYSLAAAGNTCDAEFVWNTSLYPLPPEKGAVNYVCSNHTFPSIAKNLKNEGYETYAFHGNDASFWNRAAIYPRMGYGELISGEKMKPGKKVGLGLCDEDFYKQVVDYIAQRKVEGKEKIYSFLISLTSHTPFIGCNGTNTKQSVFENYIASIKYADYCIGVLIENLKKENLYDDTVLVLYGDHAGIQYSDSIELCKLLNIPYNEYTYRLTRKVPAIIHLPQQEKEVCIDNLTSQLDLLPTIANIMGIKLKFYLGEDFLSPTRKKSLYVVFADGSIITDTYIYINGNDQYYDILNQKTKEITKEIQEEIVKYQREIRFSEQILETDIFSFYHLAE